ncbi:hypothetical protein NQZ68_038283 [Dissostichus eleginoides]|nr:hypothetical protein NQZ68_038283 [Dissostichus eleginoides]
MSLMLRCRVLSVLQENGEGTARATLYLWLCFYLGLRLRGYFYFYYLLLGYGYAACTKPSGRGRVSQKDINEDHRHDKK